MFSSGLSLVFVVHDGLGVHGGTNPKQVQENLEGLAQGVLVLQLRATGKPKGKRRHEHINFTGNNNSTRYRYY